jgi:transcriptional regulator with XRE-family HTH domain
VTEPQAGVGTTIRVLRKKAGRSLKEVSAEVGVSESFLSQVERGVTNPSIASLYRIAEALGAPMTSLFTGPVQPARLLTVRDQSRISHPFNAEEDVLLTPRDAQHVQMILSTVGPGGGPGQELYSHGGEEEYVVVLDGNVEIRVPGRTYQLAAGDVLLLDPRAPHGFSNNSDAQVRLLWVTAPPP